MSAPEPASDAPPGPPPDDIAKPAPVEEEVKETDAPSKPLPDGAAVPEAPEAEEVKEEPPAVPSFDENPEARLAALNKGDFVLTHWVKPNGDISENVPAWGEILDFKPGGDIFDIKFKNSLLGRKWNVPLMCIVQVAAGGHTAGKLSGAEIRSGQMRSQALVERMRGLKFDKSGKVRDPKAVVAGKRKKKKKKGKKRPVKVGPVFPGGRHAVSEYDPKGDKVKPRSIKGWDLNGYVVDAEGTNYRQFYHPWKINMGR